MLRGPPSRKGTGVCPGRGSRRQGRLSSAGAAHQPVAKWGASGGKLGQAPGAQVSCGCANIQQRLWMPDSLPLAEHSASGRPRTIASMSQALAASDAGPTSGPGAPVIEVAALPRRAGEPFASRPPPQLLRRPRPPSCQPSHAPAEGLPAPPAPGACQGCCAAASPACAPGVMQSTFFPRLIDHDFLERGRPPTFKPGGRSRLTRSTRTSRCRGARPRFDAGLRSRSARRWRPCQARPEPPAPSPFRVGPRARSRPQPWPVFPTSGGRLRCALPIWPRPSGAQ